MILLAVKQHGPGLFGKTGRYRDDVAQVDAFQAVFVDHHIKGLLGRLKLANGAHPVIFPADTEHPRRDGGIGVGDGGGDLVDGDVVTGHAVDVEVHVQLVFGAAEDKQ
jgi:hypothetical protein